MLLTDLCDIYSGTSFPKKLYEDDTADYLVIESNSVTDDNLLCETTLKKLSASQHPLPSNQIKKQDILVRGKGLRHGAILIEKEFPVPVVATSYFLVLRMRHTKLCSAAQLASYLNLADVQICLGNLSGGGTVKHLTKTRLSGFEFNLPAKAQLETLEELQSLIRTEQALQSDLHKLKQQRNQIMSKHIMGTTHD